MDITITLNAGMGTDLGPNFNLTANTGTVSPSTATKTELLAGKLVTVDAGATSVTVTSTGTCTNSLNLPIEVPSYTFALSYSVINQATACSNYPSVDTTDYYTSSPTLENGTIIYQNIGMTVVAPNGYYSDGTYSYQIYLGAGALDNKTIC